MPQTNLAQAIEATNDAGSAYDTNVKFLLADRQILARILKYTISEFSDMEIPEIMGSIGDDIEIGMRPIEPGLSNLGQVKKSDTEDNVPGEGKIFYDIRFSAYHLKEKIKFLLNIEAQRSADPQKLGYHLENRILFYLSRMISAQKQTEFFHSDYDSIKRVRSIWICLNDEEDGDSIEEISLARKDIFGKRKNPYSTDLMKGIIVNIRNRENVEGSQNVLISMLENLLLQNDIEKKKRILTEQYGMIMTTELEGRIQTMCNLSENIKEKGIEEGIEKGIEKGIKKGIEEGIEKERLNAIGRMLKVNVPKEQILSFGYTEEEFAKVESMMCVNV